MKRKNLFEILTFAKNIFIIRLKSTCIYALFLTIIALLTCKSHPTFCEIILGMILTLIVADSINQHYQEWKHREITRKILSNIYSSYFCVFEIFCILTNSFETEMRDLQKSKVLDGTLIMKNISQKLDTKNTIDISQNNLHMLRGYLKNLKEYMVEALTLTKSLDSNFEIYGIIQELEDFNKILNVNIEEKFQKQTASPIEIIFAGLNNGFLKEILEKYYTLILKLEKNIFLKNIERNLERKVELPPCVLPLSKEQQEVLNTELKARQQN